MTADDVRARLLPCPFCGCTDHETSPWPTDRNRDWWKCNCGNPECGVEVGAPTPDEAIAKWNRRAAHADLSGEVRELVEACKERDEADGRYGAAEQMYGEDSNEPEMREARGRIMRANKRYLAALAKFSK